MEKLRLYINSLSPEQRESFAASCGTTVGYLRKAISSKTKFDGALARRIDESSLGHICRAELRPDIWPELVKASVLVPLST